MIKWNMGHKQEHYPYDGTIPSRATIIFELDDGEIEVRVRNGALVMTTDNRLSITPCASNQIQIKNRE